MAYYKSSVSSVIKLSISSIYYFFYKSKEMLLFSPVIGTVTYTL